MGCYVIKVLHNVNVCWMYFISAGPPEEYISVAYGAEYASSGPLQPPLLLAPGGCSPKLPASWSLHHHPFNRWAQPAGRIPPQGADWAGKYSLVSLNYTFNAATDGRF